MDKKKLSEIANILSASPKGILAADESTGTITKRFDQINLKSTFETRRKYRELLFTTNELEKYISGVILYDETIKQEDSSGERFTSLLKKKNIQSGIKVDAGAKELIGSKGEYITEGLDNLSQRMFDYSNMGATFAKWRAVISIGESAPSEYCIELNSHALARYARIVQHYNMVPIVEPEILMDGSHSLEKCYEVTSKTLKSLFSHLNFQGVYLGGILLKPNMIISGIDSKEQSSVKDVSKNTINCLKQNVPDEVPGIVFLSGGQNNDLATSHLNEMNITREFEWNLSFSYGRALQQPVILSWKGQDENKLKAQNELLKRSRLNSLATTGNYSIEMEKI